MSSTVTVPAKKHQATFILDTRGTEASADDILARLQGVVREIGATVDSAENLGRRDFVRVTDRAHPGDYFVRIVFTGPLDSAKTLRAKLKLEKAVKRLLVELV